MQDGSATDLLISDVLASEGFVGTAARRARSMLESEALTRPHKSRIAADKLIRVRRLLRERLARLCASCQTIHPEFAMGRDLVEVLEPQCEVCAGSNNRRAGYAARRALQTAGARHLLVVGGSRTTHAALRASLEDEAIEVRCIDGTAGARPAPTVDADLDWADLLIVWASTPLPHKVSQPYTSRARGRVPMITVPRRGVEAVCHALVRWDAR